MERSDSAGRHDIAIRGVGARLVASLRDTVACHDESERLFDELRYHMRELRGRRQRGAVFHACRAGAVDCQAFVVLPTHIDAGPRVRLERVPAQRVASLVYRGEDFTDAYRALRTWMAVGGVRVVGPKREIYLEDGGPDAECVTEIQVPVQLEPERLH